MKFDDILIEIGEFGTYQKRIYCILLFSWILSGPFLFGSVFVLAVPKHRCKIPGYSNDSYEVHGSTHQLLINHHIPLSSEEGKTYDECHLYHFNQSHALFNNESRPMNASITKCTSWVYSHELFDNTYVMEASLVCDNKYKASLSQTIFFGGVLAGSFIFGVISDLLGRRKTLLIAVTLLFASSLATIWANSYITFVILRFCSGMFVVGVFMTAYVTGMEWVGLSKRTFVGLVISIVSPFGALYLSLVSYLFKKWTLIEAAATVPVAIFGLFWWFIPESPRWLCSKGRLQEARSLLQHAASVNKREFPEKKFSNLTPDKKETGKVWLLFSNKPLAIWSLVIFYNWLVVSMVFFGLGLNTGKLFGNFYINFVISALLGFPGQLLPLWTIDRFGRKKCHCLYMFFAGVACLSTIFTVNFGGKDLQTLTTTLALIGQTFAAAAFATIYVFSAEIFPTAVRNAGMGTSSSFARVGAMVSPFIEDLADLVKGKGGQAVPLAIFGGACVIGAGLTLILPETLNQSLPETVENVRNSNSRKFGHKSSEPISTVEGSVTMTRFFYNNFN